MARERELAQLDGFLDKALAGQGRVVFVTGDAAQGKTALIREFARRAQAAHPDLVVASRHGNAHTGIGDPYLPFREVLGLLSGDVEARWAAGAITRDRARRLWHTLPLAAQALEGVGPDLIDLFVSGAALVKRTVAFAPVGADWLPQLEELVQRKAALPGDPNLQQSALFEQYSQVVEALARQRPLLLVLDDLRWADAGSVSLLFHLGRRIEGSRILIVGAYRPAEVALGRLASPSQVGGIEGGARTTPAGARRQVQASLQWLSLFPLTGVALAHDRIPEAVEYARALLEPRQQALPDSLQTVLKEAIKTWERGEPEAARPHLDRAIELAQEMGYL